LRVTTPFADLPADERPLAAGRGVAYRLPAVSPAVAQRAPVAGLDCGSPPAARLHSGRGTGVSGTHAVHLELYAKRLVLPVPAGIGVAPPHRRRGAYVLGGACFYGVRTLEPTGLVLVEAGVRASPPTVATLFALWGQPLSDSRLAGFRGRVLAFVAGRPWRGPPGAIPLTPHAEIVLEVGGYVPPHRTYLFPPGG
jgi:hypothetical protein